MSKHDLQKVWPHFTITGSENIELQNMQTTFFGKSSMKMVISSTVVDIDREGLREPVKEIESSIPVASLLWSEMKVRAEVSDACLRCRRVALRACVVYACACCVAEVMVLTMWGKRAQIWCGRGRGGGGGEATVMTPVPDQACPYRQSL